MVHKTKFHSLTLILILLVSACAPTATQTKQSTADLSVGSYYLAEELRKRKIFSSRQQVVHSTAES